MIQRIQCLILCFVRLREGFNRQVNVYLKAKSFFGARNGLATLQQLIWYDDEDNLLRILSTAHVTDKPKFR